MLEKEISGWNWDPPTVTTTHNYKHCQHQHILLFVYVFFFSFSIYILRIIYIHRIFLHFFSFHLTINNYRCRPKEIGTFCYVCEFNWRHKLFVRMLHTEMLLLFYSCFFLLLNTQCYNTVFFSLNRYEFQFNVLAFICFVFTYSVCTYLCM